MSPFMLKHFRAMANIKPQSSLTQQQGMQVNFVNLVDGRIISDHYQLIITCLHFCLIANLQAVDLTKLNLMQLTQFKNGLDSDLQFYQESLQNLKMAQSK